MIAHVDLKEAAMFKTNPLLVSIAALLVASIACAVPNISLSVPPTQDPNQFSTIIAETVAAALVQTQQVATTPTPSLAPVLLATDTPSMTFTPTFTPTVTLTPSPIFTSTPVVPLISVSVATNCRVGPGKVYDRVGALLVGEVAEIYGRNADGTYWYIRNPDSNGGFCWLWGEYATLTGNFAALPMYTPPPTPTPMPAFDPSYSGKDTCAGWWVDFDLENTGGVTFKSLSLTLRDTVTDGVLSLYTDGFTNRDGCLDSTTRDNLNPGDVRTFSSPAFDYDPTGHRLRATITLCTGLGQNGMCVTEVVTFTP
jgi:hypothetical protein